MKSLVVLFATFVITCGNPPPLPPQSSYGITSVYRECDKQNNCKVITVNEDNVRTSNNDQK